MSQSLFASSDKPLHAFSISMLPCHSMLGLTQCKNTWLDGCHDNHPSAQEEIMGAYKYLEEMWRKKQSESWRELLASWQGMFESDQDPLSSEHGPSWFQSGY